MTVRSCAVELTPTRPRLSVGAIFRRHGEAFRESHALTWHQMKALRSIQRCRTEALGGHLYACQDCGYSVPMYNSCRNRHCPTCQSLSQAKWLAKRMERVLPAAHFHTVFTLPAEIRPLARRNPTRIYPLLFRAAARTLQKLAGDPRHLGAVPGITAVLHTWTRDLHYHPHVHCVITAGGLAPDGTRWIPSRGNGRYLFPVRLMSKVFRTKFLTGLQELVRQGALDLGGPCEALAEPYRFAAWKDRLYRAKNKWIVYAKKPFAGTQHVFKYLGRYTHRVAISDQRILSWSHDAVTFFTKKGKPAATLPPEEFIRRFLLHILPTGFVKIRHFGLYASGNVNTKLAIARQLIPPPQPAEPPSERPETISQLVADLLATLQRQTCPHCGSCLVRSEPLHPVPTLGLPHELGEPEPP